MGICEGTHGRRVLCCGKSERLGEQETLKNSIRGEREDGHKEHGNNSSDNSAAYHSRVRRGDSEVSRSGLSKEEESSESVTGTNACNSKDHVDRSNSADGTETSGVQKDQSKSL